MNRFSALFFASSASLSLVLAGCHSSSKPKDVLQAFLQADSDADGLSAQTWPDLGRYTTWTSAPSWDKFMVIDHYDVGDAQIGSTRAQISVTYHNVGQMGTTFIADAAPETVVFHLNLVDNAWKVDSPHILPHVSWPVMQKRLADASAADPKVKAANDALIAQITAAAGHS